MSSIALYRKYRSKSLDEVVGQSHITDVLSRALKQDKIAHAYLFTGPRGVGKTSIARILAYEINKTPYDETTLHPDIIEIDAASNRRIDDIRELREKVQIAPTTAKYKVYIIDEVHMLTGESFNAFLKTLEEPPEHVVFILATTDAHKLPVTITSRTQRFTFRSITTDDAVMHLKSIAKQEKIDIEDEALKLIAQHGDGSFRDSISLLDQLSSLTETGKAIDRQLVEHILGMAEQPRIDSLLDAYSTGDQSTIITSVSELEKEGVAPQVIANQLIQAIRSKLGSSPNLIPLLDLLVAVSRSPRPDIKLLTALLSFTTSDTPLPTKAKTAATLVAAPRELKVLEKEATKPHPSESRVRPALKEAKEAKTIIEPTTAKEPVQEIQTPKKKNKTKAVDFNWSEYVETIRGEAVAVASILAKCKGELDDDTLTIYTGTAFWKKKLDDVKYQPVLHDGLKSIGLEETSIETIPTTAPPKDSQAAAVAAIMGGGEEVSLEDS